jgi:hypothetical protein
VRAAAKKGTLSQPLSRIRGRGITTAPLLLLLLSLPACPRSKLPRPDGAAVVLAPERPEGEVAPVPEVEPNDTIAKAQRLLVAPTAPAAVAGAVAWEPKGKPDVDVYRIDLPGPDGGVDAASAPPGPAGADAALPPPPRPKLMARIEVTPEATVAVKLEVLDGAGKPLIAAAGADPGQPLAIPNFALTGPTPYVRVRRVASGDAPGSYKIVVRVLPLDAGAELEPDDVAAQANELTLPGEAIGYLGWRRDQDWYRLPTAALADGSVLAVDLDPIPGVSARLALVDAAGHKLSEARGRRAERVALRNVSVPPGTAQLYLVASADFGSNADQRYDLRVSADLPKPGAEAEPNDDAAHAQAVGDGTVQGFLARGDVDVFRYTIAAPVMLTVEIALPERATAKLEISNEAGVVLARGKPTGRGRKPLRASLRVDAGTVLVRVVAGSGEGNPDEPYRLTISSRPPDSDAPAPAPSEE